MDYKGTCPSHSIGLYKMIKNDDLVKNLISSHLAGEN